ncbi:MAG TPA: hypothetical protein PLJ27_18230 [Polyangiaceae bacterium]|nr:hypothetical protein [Polyangiaceae bacterium]HNZ23999.1 hypothetical protein [Polyangiaceae bacterium]HOD21750.1 hypothetical protein [Polyangiaceae bacterium]HOE51080.1 hypothetical protein [Polyangiaceae bacterium]HOH02282.1 hypothetical protein [Polyangiaceae bacterium]
MLALCFRFDWGVVVRDRVGIGTIPSSVMPDPLFGTETLEFVGYAGQWPMNPQREQSWSNRLGGMTFANPCSTVFRISTLQEPLE